MFDQNTWSARHNFAATLALNDAEWFRRGYLLLFTANSRRLLNQKYHVTRRRLSRRHRRSIQIACTNVGSNRG